MDSLSALLDRSQAKQYYAVNDSPIVLEGRQDATISVDTAGGPSGMAVSAAATPHTSEDIMAVCKTMDSGFDVVFSSTGCVMLSSDLPLLGAAVTSSERIPFYREGDKFYLDYDRAPGSSSPERLAPIAQSASHGDQDKETDEKYSPEARQETEPENISYN